MIHNYVLESASAPGTSSTVTLGGAPTGRVSFVSQFGTGGQCYYFITDDTQAEAGYGVVTAGPPDTLTRSTVLWTTAGGTSRLNFAGACRVYNALPGEVVLYRSPANQVDLVGARIMRAGAGLIAGDGAQLGQVGWQVISAASFPYGVTSVVFALPSTYGRFRLEWQDTAAAASGRLIALFSTDGGVTYRGASGDYTWFANRLSAGVSAQDSATEGVLRLSPTLAAGEVQTGRFEFQFGAGQGTTDNVGLASTVFTRCVGAGISNFTGPLTHVSFAVTGTSFTTTRVRLLGSLS